MLPWAPQASACCSHRRLGEPLGEQLAADFGPLTVLTAQATWIACGGTPQHRTWTGRTWGAWEPSESCQGPTSYATPGATPVTHA
jgi:hypothetical protein